MNDDKIKELFEGFRPEIGTDTDFISRLEIGLAAIETVKRQQAAMRRNCRISAVIASVAGFLTGKILAFYQAEVTGIIARILHPALHLPQPDYISASWLLTAAAAITVALTGYEASFRLLRSISIKHSNH